jgi:hypothetical protein
MHGIKAGSRSRALEVVTGGGGRRREGDMVGCQREKEKRRRRGKVKKWKRRMERRWRRGRGGGGEKVEKGNRRKEKVEKGNRRKEKVEKESPPYNTLLSFLLRMLTPGILILQMLQTRLTQIKGQESNPRHEE